MIEKEKVKIALLGASGSIGQNAINCITYLNRNENCPKAFQITALSIHSNITFLKQFISSHQSICDKKISIAVTNPNTYQEFKNFIKTKINLNITLYDSVKILIEEIEFDLLVNAIVGSAGLSPTIVAIDKKKSIAIANKETLIIAGDLISNKIKKNGVSLIPIDSEHFALLHLLEKYKKKDISRVIITASGGAFWKNNIVNPTIEDALNHPNWKMGNKITIDSATMMNKGLEVIEAHFLFDLPFHQIETIIHPQSIVHAIVETINGEQIAQLGHADMRHPIQNALTYPDIIDNSLKKFNLWDKKKLEFHPMDFERFPVLRLAYDVGKRGGTGIAIMNAANEIAVALFLNGKIEFSDIYKIVSQTVAVYTSKKEYSLEEILTIDSEVKSKLKKDYNLS